jgi:NAD(P)-dependent dehydrogenase (short-subunit alcohol dehydrogenase family)
MSEPNQKDRKWSASDIPDQTGRTALVTGASSGIGLEAARALAAAGGRVLLGCRNPDKASAAVESIRSSTPDADLTVVALDLANLASVREAAIAVQNAAPTLELLINNAGVMAIPLQRTTDGFEMQFGTNHLGHFALTGLLVDRLNDTPGARVVNVSSTGHKMGRIAFDDLDAAEGYHRWLRYGQSKVANLLFTYELQRRLAADDATTIALACHPGGASTELSRDAGTLMKLFQPAADLFMQSAAMGALPTLRAATDPMAKGGDYYGPDGLSGMRGYPIKVHSSGYSHRQDVAAQLWNVSEQLTGVAYLD